MIDDGAKGLGRGVMKAGITQIAFAAAAAAAATAGGGLTSP